ncbi:hypothetical protein CPAV1605_683 [seawater metagenome]|uniref:Uncharacterized protein n=1 Tax=seawater metagenome TaxID=1561972 RepID=A0A5E8CHS4_9ZZZZ
MNNLVIYHKNCNDGFGAALVAWLKFGDDAEYYAANHYSNPPNVSNKNVYILDFSYSADIINKMLKEVQSLIIIDHHLSAKKDLEQIPVENKIFDMNHSGATLSWNYFFPNTKTPLLLEYIEDRDIWKNELENTKECFFGLNEIKKDFKIWKQYLDDEKVKDLLKTGSIIYNHNQDLINFLSRSSYLKSTVLSDNKSYNIAYLNSSVLKSDLGNHLLVKVYPEADFSAIYHYDGGDNKTIYSLRSTDEKTDVSEIAKKYNGGGHRNASGLAISGFQINL